ncbi:MAG: Crp/Fnr family transcriptional regulator [Gemmataceae bacterium]
MSGAEPSPVVKRHAFLERLQEAQRQLLEPGLKSFTAAPGEYLAREGEPAHAFYLIQSGHVAIGTHLGERGAVPIQTVGPGDVVGWSWVVPPYRWQFDARAVDRVEGLFFEAAWLRELCEKNTTLGYQVLKQLIASISSRLAATRLQKLDVYG